MRRLILLASATLLAACGGGRSAHDSAAVASAAAHLASALAQAGVQCEDHEPPAVAACDGKPSGAACQVVDDEGAAQGTCKSIPDGREVCAGADADDRDGGEAEDGGVREAAHADADGGEGPRGIPTAPPVLVAACAKAAANAACSVQLDERTISGTCRSVAGVLLCLPQPPPPPAPVTACAQKAPGATCSFTVGSRTVQGTCRAFAETNTLACIPAPGPVSPPPAAVDACVDHAVGATCSVAVEGHLLPGVCRTAPSGVEVCAPSCSGR